MRKLRYVFLLLSTAIIAVSCGDNKKAKNFNNKTIVDDQAEAFIKKATEAGLTEIKASAIAETLSKNPRIIRFAKIMMEDHTEANKELAQLADNKLVDKADTISVQHQKTVDSIAHLNSLAFDKAYINMMLKEHNQAVALFEETSRNKNNAVQQLAKKILPSIKMHLDSAKAIAKALQ